jgi:hypothetical protein
MTTTIRLVRTIVLIGLYETKIIDYIEPICRVSSGKIGVVDTGKRDYRHH